MAATLPAYGKPPEAAPVLAAAFGAGVVAVTGGGLAAAVMLVPILLPALRRIEVNRER